MLTYGNLGEMLLRRTPMAFGMKASQKMKASPKVKTTSLKAKAAKQTFGTTTRKPQSGPDRSKYGV